MVSPVTTRPRMAGSGFTPTRRTIATPRWPCSAHRRSVLRTPCAAGPARLWKLPLWRGGAAPRKCAVRESWTAHPQGRAVASDPLVIRAPGGPAASPHWAAPTARPLQGVRVLDMTRVLAGPVATRFLAGFGAEVLRIDPPSWNEPGVVPDVTLGKRCARLDLRRAEDRTVWEGLLRRADVLVHGYRPGALDGLGLDAERRSTLCPGLVDVSLDAYGWSGPWRGRRGFDSLVQMSSGIAEAGMRHFGRDRPTPLPVQALDHATGYIIATAVIRGLTERLANGTGCTTRVSLARTAALLASLSPGAPVPMPPVTQDDLQEAVEQTDWGPARRLRHPARSRAHPCGGTGLRATSARPAPPGLRRGWDKSAR